MEKIIFKKSGSIEKFIEWIERFKGEISKDSLIIEIDTAKNLFISKTFSDDKSLVRYSEISFEDANLQMEIGQTTPDSRVLIGIFGILPKFIDVAKTFATSESFSMEIDYDMMDVKGKPSLCAVSVQFKSKTLRMTIPGCSLNATEMTPLDDDVFKNRVWVADAPITVKLSGDLLKNLVSISDIFVSNEKLKNFMEFYTADNENGKKVLKVKDPRQESYDYAIGELEEGSAEMANDIVLSIYRERFLLAVKNAFADTTLTISSTNPNRLLIQLGDGGTKTIIARVNREEN